MARLVLLAAALTMMLAVPADASTKRSQSAKFEFRQQHACPATGRHKGPCPGFVIDHVRPLACGGADRPDNMQWQTVAEGKAKDKWERRACGK